VFSLVFSPYVGPPPIPNVPLNGGLNNCALHAASRRETAPRPICRSRGSHDGRSVGFRVVSSSLVPSFLFGAVRSSKDCLQSVFNRNLKVLTNFG